MKRLITTIILATAILVGSITPLSAQSPDKLFQKGLIKEEGEGALNKAINIYNKIVENRNADKSLQAKALLHMGLCYEKLGRNEATKAYQRLVNNFPGQKNEVAIARERLSQLILIAEKIPKGIVIKQVWSGSDVDNSGSVSLDGKYLSFVDWNTGDLALRNLKTRENQRITHEATLEYPQQFAYINKISPDGKQIAYYWYNEEKTIDLKVINLSNKSQVTLDNSKGDIYPALWFSNGENIIVQEFREKVNGPCQLSSINVNTGESQVLKEFENSFFTNVSLSPDEKYLAFDFLNGNQNGNIDINLLLIEGKKEIPLIEHPANDRLLGWLPGKKEILFISDRSGTWDLWAIPVVDGKPAESAKRLYIDIGKIQAMGFTENGDCYYSFFRRIFNTYIAPFNVDTGELNEQSGKPILGSNFQAKWSPDGKYLAYINENFKADNFGPLIVQDITTGKKRKLATDLFAANSPCWSPDGNSILVIGRSQRSKYTAKDYNGGIYLVDVKTGQTSEILLLSDYEFKRPDDAAWPISDIQWSLDGKSIFYLFFKDRLVKHDLETGKEKVLYKQSNFDRGILARSPDGKSLLFAVYNPKEKKSHLFTMPVEGGKEIELCTSQAGRTRATWSPDGKSIFFSNGLEGTNLWRISVEGGIPEKVWHSKNIIEFPSIHPDGKQMVFSIRERTTEIRVIEGLIQEAVQSKNIMIRKFMDGAGSEFYGAPSPNGKYFSFIDYKTYPNDIVIKEIETEKEIRLRNHPDISNEGDEGTPYNPVWSPDSKQIAYVWENDKDNFYELRVIEVNNAVPETLIRVSYENGWIKSEDWSPDGKYILVQLTENNMDQLGLVSVFEGSFQQLKKIGKTAPYSAKFSPDGKHIAFDNPPNEENTEHDIFVISIDGKQETKITSHPSYDYFLDWSPSGEKILFASDRTGTTDMWSISFSSGSDQKTPELVSENIGNIKTLGTTNEGSFYYSTSGSWWDIYTTTFDPESGKVISSPTELPLPFQGYNRHPVWSPNGKYLAYVSVRKHLRKPNILCIYSKETGAVKEFAYEKDVNRPVWFPDSQSVLLFGTDVLNITTGKIESVIQLKKDDELEKFALSISSDSKSIYYETRNKNWDKHAIIQMNKESGEKKELYTTTDDNLTMSLSPDNKQLALLQRHNENTRILKIVSITDSSEKIIHTFKQDDFGYIDLAWSPNGKYIYFSKKTDADWVLCRISATSGVAENLDAHKNLFTSVSVHPNGQLITFSSFVGKEKPGGVWVMENYLPSETPANLAPPQLTNKKIWANPDTDNSGTPSPDGRFLTYMDQETGNVAIRELSSGKTHLLTKEGTWEDPMQFTIGSAISPNSRQVAYSWYNLNNNYDVRITDIDDPQAKILYGNKDEDVFPCAWSPDGKIIYARSYLNTTGQCRILAITVSNGNIQVLKTFDFFYWMSLSASPDNQFIAYDVPNDKDGGSFDIHLISTDGKNETSLIEHPANDRILGWFPDKDQILFKSDRSGTWDAWIVSVSNGKISGKPMRLMTNLGQVTPMGFTENGTYYYSIFSRKFTAFTAPFDQIKGELKIGSGKPLLGSISYAEWSPDGNFLAYIKELTGAAGPGWYHRPLFVLDIKTGKERKYILSDNCHFRYPKWSPDGKTLLVSGYDEERELEKDYKGGIYTIEVKSGKISEVITFSKEEKGAGLEWSDDQKSIYYIKNNQLINRKLASGQKKILLQDQKFSRSLDLSPDGKNLLFSAEGQIYIIPISGGDPISVVKVNTTAGGGSTLHNNAVWSPNKNYVFFTENMGTDGSILWRISAKGKNPTEIWRSKDLISAISIHPKGQKIVLSTFDQETEIWRLDNLLSIEESDNE